MPHANQTHGFGLSDPFHCEVCGRETPDDFRPCYNGCEESTEEQTDPRDTNPL